MLDRADFWAGHLAAIDAEGVTTRVYAEREGLAATSLYQWRRRLKAGGRPSRAAAVSGGFLPVTIQTVQAAAAESACCLRIGEDLRLELAQLPSPDWLAALAAAVGVR
jgi:transposase